MTKRTDSTAAPVRGERLQKVLAQGGVASRRHAEELIREGRVRVNGRVVTELGTRADPRRDRVEVDGKRVVAEKHVYLVLHKPRNVVSTMSDPEGRPTVKELLGHVDARVYPVGRLDFGTSGVLLATNDGAFADALLHPRKAVPKTYVVKVSGTMRDGDLDVWRSGVQLDDGKTLPADVSLIRYEPSLPQSRGKTWLEVTIREGRNQQIRRMGEATGFPVMRLSRTSFAGVTGEGLRPGAVRSLVRAELALLKKAYGVPKSIPSEMESHESRARPRPPWRGKREASSATSESPRYGMGAPGRRSPETTEDYGGRSGRGSSGGSREQDASPPPRGALGGGRFSATRTTGTGGGIGAGHGSHRSSRGRRGHGK